MPTVGILAIQGDFLEHTKSMQDLGVEIAEIRLPSQLENIDGLIIPGGESTTIGQLIDFYQIRQPIINKVRTGMPIWGTCAGMIMLSTKIQRPRRSRTASGASLHSGIATSRPTPLKLMGIEVTRNAFGRQIDSFEEDIKFDGIDGPPFPGIFIRAPMVNNIVAKEVQTLAVEKNGSPVAIKQNHMLATSFHPELTSDNRVHKFFLEMIKESI